MTTIHYTCTMDSPIGPLELRAGPETLTSIRFVDIAPAAQGEVDASPASPANPANPANVDDSGNVDDSDVLRAAITQLDEYFAGERTDFDLPLHTGGTPFQQQVWSMLAEIPYAETWSYAELARRIGSPTAFRAVGAANGQNPLPIVLPCHRVVGANGTLVGYGGGMDRKRTLLQLEATVQLQRDFG
ncbi:methylated-DNA--[protein]-cysteine S-methyltransferase [Actinopolymorpha sp. B17G11]|uniref:methylated-DNA--[protein]-cysteine S-methyltransferase n=1 Tax=Actinopolymorpha sp. B17G11 TaxID=3160861 RepID=UPI0032E49D06